MVKRMEMRLKVPKENNRQSYIRKKTEIRPLFNRLTPYGAVNSRSPLVSMIFPSMQDKIKIFQDDLSKKEGTHNSVPGVKKSSSTFVKRAELEKIVEMETKRRNQMEHQY